MAKVSTSITIDAEVKAKAQELFSDLGLDFSTAINIFLRQAIRENRIPFDIQRPTNEDETEDAGEEQAPAAVNDRRRRAVKTQPKSNEIAAPEGSPNAPDNTKADKHLKNESAKKENTPDNKPEGKADAGDKLSGQSGKADKPYKSKAATSKDFKTFTDMDEMIRSLIT